MTSLKPGDRVRIPRGSDATIIRPNRLDPDKWVLWPDTWGRLPVNTTNGPGMCLRGDTLTRIPNHPSGDTPTTRPALHLAPQGPTNANPSQQR